MSKEIKYKDVVPNSIVTRYKEVRQEYEQEPVAWIATGIGGGTAVGWYEKDIVNLPKGTKLYLHPPKREPLTPQQISEGNQSTLNVTREAFKQGVIFAEKAHGITGGGE